MDASVELKENDGDLVHGQSNQLDQAYLEAARAWTTGTVFGKALGRGGTAVISSPARVGAV